ncbi:MAG: TIGR03862 family flavoprotein [Bacteroidota bacterium]|nr:TIGR03862 family flavoprotein [Bacteroidota bacterium]
MKKVAIIGAGPAALMLAAQLDQSKFQIEIYERNPTAARKMLVAGDGGLNLTHSEDEHLFVSRYIPERFLDTAFLGFNNKSLCEWFSSIGIQTFTGSSKRIFPMKGIKPIEVVNAILKVLSEKGTQIHYRHLWKGWKGNDLVFEKENLEIQTTADIYVFALGGGSWKVTGSDGSWIKPFKEKGIKIQAFQPSNCTFMVDWKPDFLALSEGMALKNISVQCDKKIKKGEVVITARGIEGGAIYSLSPEIRKQLQSKKTATLYIDLKPDLGNKEVLSRIKNRGSDSVSAALKNRIRLSSVQSELLKSILTKEEYINAEILAQKIKKLPVRITGLAELDEAISTVGGISLDQINENYQLKSSPNTYAIGEMLDWDAPTGGYLLQGCFSMGHQLAHHLNAST